MNKRMWTGALLLAAALVATGCGGSKDGGDSAPENGQSPAAGGADRTITVNAKNFEFDQKEIRVKQGETITLTLNSTQGNHGLKIDGYGEEVKNGGSVTFTADKAGEFKFYCSVMCGAGHADMTGKLIVE